jgi:hypothetical protein
MARKSLQRQLLVICLLIAGSIFGARQAWSGSAQGATDAIRQSVIQGIRDDIQRRIERQVVTGEPGHVSEKPLSPTQRASGQAAEKQ